MIGAGANDKYLIISTDGHCGADLRDYKPYLEKRFHEELDAWADNYHDAWAGTGNARPIDSRVGFASFGTSLNWDSARRLEYAASQGVAVEVLFPNTSPPFFPSGAISAPGPRNQSEYEHRFAGLKAHNRWLAEFCADTPGRRVGLAQIFLDDLDAAIDEVRWAKDHGLGGVMLPGDHVLRMANLYYPSLDRLWAVCADLGLPIHRHANTPCESAEEAGVAAPWIGSIELEFFEKRAITHLICSGVFERFPTLKLVSTELTNGSSMPAYLARLDDLWSPQGFRMRSYLKSAFERLSRPPSEYFRTNCLLAGPLDLGSASENGAPNLMFGADIPHSEGTAPYTQLVLRRWFATMPDEDLRTLLGLRAAEVYNVDASALQPVVEEIGLSVKDLSTPLTAGESPRFPEDTECRMLA